MGSPDAYEHSPAAPAVHRLHRAAVRSASTDGLPDAVDRSSEQTGGRLGGGVGAEQRSGASRLGEGAGQAEKVRSKTRKGGGASGSRWSLHRAPVAVAVAHQGSRARLLLVERCSMQYGDGILQWSFKAENTSRLWDQRNLVGVVKVVESAMHYYNDIRRHAFLDNTAPAVFLKDIGVEPGTA